MTPMSGYLVTRWAYSATDPLLGTSVFTLLSFLCADCNPTFYPWALQRYATGEIDFRILFTARTLDEDYPRAGGDRITDMPTAVFAVFGDGRHGYAAGHIVVVP